MLLEFFLLGLGSMPLGFDLYLILHYTWLQSIAQGQMINIDISFRKEAVFSNLKVESLFQILQPYISFMYILRACINFETLLTALLCAFIICQKQSLL